MTKNTAQCLNDWNCAVFGIRDFLTDTRWVHIVTYIEKEGGEKMGDTKDVEVLKALIRFDIDKKRFDGSEKDEAVLNLEEIYRPTYKDIVMACENMIEKNVDADTFLRWYKFVSDDISDYYADTFINAFDSNILWPGNDIETRFGMTDELLDLANGVEYRGVSTDELEAYLKQIIKIAENYESNKNKPAEEWILTNAQRETILLMYSDNPDTVIESRIPLFRRIVEEGCEEGNLEAMKCKAYSCYGGNRIYECNWDTSRDLFVRLFEETEEPGYANTLGYIYYYGRCNYGEPEYDIAFKYFAIGAAHGLIESMYKMSDMFSKGKGCIKSVSASDEIINNLYEDARSQFCFGKDASFADVALRKAGIYMRKEEYIKAFCCYLEAEYAINERMKKSSFFGNKKVLNSIVSGLKDAKSKLDRDFICGYIETRNPVWLKELVSGRTVIVNISKLDKSYGDNRYLMSFEIPNPDKTGSALLVIPELEYVERLVNFECEIVTYENIEYYVENPKDMLINSIDITQDGIIFGFDDNPVFIIRDTLFCVGE